MKAKITSLLLTTLLVSGCSTGFFVSSGYDDIYYSPEDEPIVVVTRKTPVASDNYYQAIDNYETEGILLESEIPVNDTIQGEYFEKGDEGVVVNNYYSGGVYDPYDYNYSRRMRLFHSPFSGVGYYSSFYDPFYWDYDPFFWGSGFYMDSWSRYRMYRRMRLYSPYYSWYSPYDYYGGYGSYYGGYGSYYGNYGYSLRPVRSNDVYYGHRRAGASNRAIASSSSPIKRSATGRSDINSRRTSANNSAVAGTRRSTDSRSSASTYTNNRRTSTDVSRSATSRKVSTTRITPRQNEGSKTSVSRRSSGSTATSRRSSTGTQRYYPSYNKTRTVSKPTYNRSSRTYQNRSSSSSSRSVYSRPSSSSSRSSSSYSAPTRSSRSSYSGSSSRSSSSGYRSSGSSRSSSSGSRSSSSSSGRSSSSSSGRRR